MRTNPERRTCLLDAAIDLLADRGARGLTFRAVDEVAGVPAGTASNYFPNRDDLLAQAGGHVFLRLAPDPTELGDRLSAPPTRELERRLMHDLMRRAAEDTAAHIAMLELRLEATRRPEIREVLTRHYRANLEANIAHHVDGGFPGDTTTVVLIYLAMTGLLVEHLTLPGMLTATGHTTDELVDAIVTTIVPEDRPSP